MSISRAKAVLIPRVARGEVISWRSQGASHEQMLCVIGKLPCWDRTLVCLVRVLFLTETQQQTMRKGKKTRAHMKCSFTPAEWQSRKLSMAFQLCLRSLISLDIDIVPFLCVVHFRPLSFHSNLYPVYGTHELPCTSLGTLTSGFSVLLWK